MSHIPSKAMYYEHVVFLVTIWMMNYDRNYDRSSSYDRHSRYDRGTIAVRAR